MFRFKNEKGLTLIELLITISVLAVVSAIALPVINNVVTSSNSNALTQTMKDADDFIAKYSKSGVVLYDGLRTLSGYVDADGDNTIDAEEKIDTLTLDDKYAISATGSAAVGGAYSNGGVTAVTVTSSGSTAAAPSASPTPTPTPSPTFAPASESAATLAAKLAAKSTAFEMNLASNFTPIAGNGQATWSADRPILLLIQNQSNASNTYVYSYVTTAEASAIAQSWTNNWASWNFPVAPVYGGSNSISPYIFHLDSDPGYGQNLIINSWASYTMIKLDGDFAASGTKIIQTTF